MIHSRLFRGIFTLALIGGLAAALVSLAEAREELFARQTGDATRIETLYHRIDDDLNDVDVSLSKLSAASSPRQSVLLLSDVWRATGSAGSAMALLPLSHADSCQMSQFIVRCGDYAHALMGTVLQGRPLTDEDRQQLQSMRQTCAQIRSLTGAAIEAGDYVSADNVDEGCYTQSESEAAISEYPTLIYDGPFSESSETQAPQGELGERITASAAESAARKLFPGCEILSCVHGAGVLPTYTLSLRVPERGEVSLDLTEQGGKLLSFMGTPQGQRDDPPNDQESQALKDAALSFLAELGYEDPVAAYAQYYQGTAVLNFAPRQEGVILYSDLIKVYLDRDSGQVMGLDASHYCLNHRPRTLSRPEISSEAAKEALSPGLTLEGEALALIPLTAKTEVLCYELKASQNGTFYILYVNALTGQEEQIFQVVNSQEGDLVV